MPAHLRTLARAQSEVRVEVEAPATIGSLLDALEDQYPVLRGAIRDHDSGKRRPFVRYFACEEDCSHDPPETPLPGKVLNGEEPFLIVGAIAGGCV